MYISFFFDIHNSVDEIVSNGRQLHLSALERHLAGVIFRFYLSCFATARIHVAVLNPIS